MCKKQCCIHGNVCVPHKVTKSPLSKSSKSPQDTFISLRSNSDAFPRDLSLQTTSLGVSEPGFHIFPIYVVEFVLIRLSFIVFIKTVQMLQDHEHTVDLHC